MSDPWYGPMHPAGSLGDPEAIASGASDVLGVVWEAWRLPDGGIQRVDFVNPQVEAMLGYTPEEWRSSPNFWLTITHPDDRERAEREARSILEGGKGGSSRFRWMGRSGRIIWVESQSVVARDEQGRPTGMRGVTMDITARLEAEERLRYQLSFTAAITNSLAEGICAVGIDGKLTFVNPAAERMLGWSRDELIGRSGHETSHWKRADGSAYPIEECPLVAAMSEGSTLRNHEELFVHRDGTLFPVVCSLSPIQADGGVMIGAVLAFQDISRRKHAELLRNVRHRVTRILAEAESVEAAAGRILSTVCESHGWDMGVLWLVDANETQLRVNEVWRRPGPELDEFDQLVRSLRFRRGGDLPGRVWSNGSAVWVPDFAESGAYLRSRAAQKLGLHGVLAFPLRLGDNVLGVIECFSRSIREPDDDLLDTLASLGHLIGLFIERKRAEAQTRQHNLELQTLLHVVSHDLKEPLRGIESFAAIVSERYMSALDERGQDFMRRIIRGATRLRRLLDDLLMLSRVRRMGMPSEEVQGDVLVSEAMGRLEHRVHESGAQVRVAGDLPLLRVDRTWAIQAIYNLLANALKFTRPGERADVEVAAWRGGDGGDEAGIVVRDRGLGVPAEHAERIFELFQRAVGREIDGTGAGLAIVREVARRHGGSAWVQPREGGGSEFVITFGRPAGD